MEEKVEKIETLLASLFARNLKLQLQKPKAALRVALNAEHKHRIDRIDQTLWVFEVGLDVGGEF